MMTVRRQAHTFYLLLPRRVFVSPALAARAGDAVQPLLSFDDGVFGLVLSQANTPRASQGAVRFEF